MDTKPTKTVRFTQLIEAAGRPEPVTLWTAPENDPEFSKAMRENRVLTIVQQNVGAKADYGLVGFRQEPLASYLVFPKKLAYPAETKVIGIKYGELAEPKPRGPIHKVVPKPARAPAPPKVKSVPEPEPPRAKEPAPPAPPPPPPPPKVFRFGAVLEIVSRQTVPLEVEATSASEAARLLQAKANEIAPSL